MPETPRVTMQRYDDANQPVGKPIEVPEDEIGPRMFAGYRQVQVTEAREGVKKSSGGIK